MVVAPPGRALLCIFANGDFNFLHKPDTASALLQTSATDVVSLGNTTWFTRNITLQQENPLAFAVHHALGGSPVPHCCFNGTVIISKSCVHGLLVPLTIKEVACACRIIKLYFHQTGPNRLREWIHKLGIITGIIAPLPPSLSSEVLSNISPSGASPVNTLQIRMDHSMYASIFTRRAVPSCHLRTDHGKIMDINPCILNEEPFNSIFVLILGVAMDKLVQVTCDTYVLNQSVIWQYSSRAHGTIHHVILHQNTLILLGEFRSSCLALPVVE